MPVTVAVNQLSVVHKASSGMSMAFPDVCKTPAPGGGIPIPYPNVAAPAIAQKQAAAAAQKTGGTTVATTSVVPMTGKTSLTAAAGVKFEGKAIALQLDGVLSNLHARLRTLPAKDPNQWQQVLEQYVSAAAALYLIKRDDD